MIGTDIERTGAYLDMAPFVASGTHAPPLTLMVLVDLRRHETYLTNPDATSNRVVYRGAVGEEPGPGAAVEDMAKLTGLSTDRLAYALGASRRSLFNWRQGKQVRPDAEARIKKAFRLVRSVAEGSPGGVKTWLETGDPPAIELMHRGMWDQLESRVAEKLAPRRPLPAQPVTDGPPETFGTETHRLTMQAFTAPRHVTPRQGWEPRELTGLGDEEEDDE
jgi:hypothetical protein